jgi:hypothetical protein
MEQRMLQKVWRQSEHSYEHGRQMNKFKECRAAVYVSMANRRASKESGGNSLVSMAG